MSGMPQNTTGHPHVRTSVKAVPRVRVGKIVRPAKPKLADLTIEAAIRNAVIVRPVLSVALVIDTLETGKAARAKAGLAVDVPLNWRRISSSKN